jgi:hypothetical protein
MAHHGFSCRKFRDIGDFVHQGRQLRQQCQSVFPLPLVFGVDQYFVEKFIDGGPDSGQCA